MIEKLGTYILNNNFEEFKKLLSNMTVNAHHREQLYKLAFLNQNEQFLDYLNSKVSLSQEKRTDFFIEALNKKHKITHFKYINECDDMYLSSKIKNNATLISSEQSNDFLINFLNKYPITTLLNLKKIIFGAIKSEKNEFMDYLTKKDLDNEILFYIGLCSVKFNKREVFSNVVKNAFKNNPNILNDVKALKEEYLLKMRGSSYIVSKDEIDSFINKTLVESFALHLEEELKIKDVPSLTNNRKKMKI